MFWNRLAFSFQIKLTPIFIFFWFWVQISNLLWKSLCSDIFLKRYFFWKSDFIGHNLKLMKFFEQIYVIVLPKQQVLPQKNMVKSNFLVSMGCGRRLICQNIHCWKNYASCIFSKVIKKLEVKQKRKTSNWAIFLNARSDVFGFFITYHFLITFEKIHKA